MKYCSVPSTAGVDGEIIPNSLDKRYMRHTEYPCYGCLCADTNVEMGSESRRAESMELARAYAGRRNQGYNSRGVADYNGGVSKSSNSHGSGQALVPYYRDDHKENPLSWALSDPGVIGDKSKSAPGKSAGRSDAGAQYNSDHTRSMSTPNVNHQNLREIYGAPPACAVSPNNSALNNPSVVAGSDIFTTPTSRSTDYTRFQNYGRQALQPTLHRSTPHDNRFIGVPTGPARAMNLATARPNNFGPPTSAPVGPSYGAPQFGNFNYANHGMHSGIPINGYGPYTGPPRGAF